MGALAILKELIDWVLVIPKLVQLNAKQRQEVRDAVGGVADELLRGLDLVSQRIEGAKRIAESKTVRGARELRTYLDESTQKLSESFSEFKICRGLREKRDQFTQLFHPARFAVRRENTKTVTRLLKELESDERMIIDEVGPILRELKAGASQPAASFLAMADQALEQIGARKQRVRRLARMVHDKL
jgi:hypothetical protein